MACVLRVFRVVRFIVFDLSLGAWLGWSTTAVADHHLAKRSRARMHKYSIRSITATIPSSITEYYVICYTLPIEWNTVMKLYRYLSGIYHFFDSFGKCGKKSGIGMVLVF